jgi:hypothetical protein
MKVKAEKKDKKPSHGRPKKKDAPLLRQIEDPKDPYRWVSIIIFLIILFISYAFWVRGQ